MDPAMQKVGTWLQCTLNPDQQQRQAAEEALRLAVDEPGHVVTLFRLAVDTSIPAELPLRQAAAINMKNVIGRRWEPRDPPKHLQEHATPALADADKAVVRSNLAEALAVSPPTIRSQLGLCLKTIANADYPEKWPELLSTICAGLSAQDHPHLHGALYSLRVLTKVYEYKREVHRAPLYPVVDATFPKLIELARAMLALPPAVQNAEMLVLIAKVMWSTTQLGLPPMLLQLPNLEPWFATMLAILEQPLPAGAPTDEDDAAKWPPFKVKKRVAAIFHRLIQRYGNPKREIEGAMAAELKAFARHFQDHLSVRCLQASLGLLGRKHSGGELMPPRIVTLSLNYIEEAIKYKLTYSMLKPRLSELFSEVLLPTLAFSERDAALWEEDAHEFVRKEYDVIEDFYSPRSAAINLLSSLTKARPKDCLHDIVSTCSSVLAHAEGSSDLAALRRKDGALLAVGSLHDRLAKKDAYRASLEPMLRRHVLPDFGSPHSFLRLRACWTYGQFALSIFANAESSGVDPSHLREVFNRMLACMRDAELPVRVRAAVAVKNVVQSDCASHAVLAVLPQLLELLFGLLKDVGLDEVVTTLDTLIEKHGAEMAPYAVQVVQALTSNFLRLLDETDADEDDESVMAALGIMQAISTMMEAIAQKPEVYVALEEPLLPLFCRCCKDDAEDFFEEMLEVLQYLTYYSPAISERLWTVVPQLHEAFHSWAREYINQILPVLDNFIHRSTELFLGAHGGAYVQSIVSMCRAVLVAPDAAEMQESDVHGGVKLIESLLHNCQGRIDALLPELVGMVLIRLGTEPCGPSLTTLLYTALGGALHYNVVLTLGILEYRQATIETLTRWVTHLQNAARLRQHDCKLLHADRHFNLDEFLKAGGDDDELEDEEQYSSPLDELDELVLFVEAVHRAAAEDTNLLAHAGMAPPPSAEVTKQLTDEEVAQVRACLEEGARKQQQRLQAPPQAQ